jgi:hypothetical protein
VTHEPKQMWSARLPGDLVDQIKQAAEEDGVSEAEIVAPMIAEGMDRRAAENR